MTGTLCRLIPLDSIEDRVVKYRVEVGDVGKTIGTVFYDMEGRYGCFYMPNDIRGELRNLEATFGSPEEAALHIAGIYVREHLPAPLMV